MEQLVALVQEFLASPDLEGYRQIDEARSSAKPDLQTPVREFIHGRCGFHGLCRELAGPISHQVKSNGQGTWLWGFSRQEEVAFLDALARVADESEAAGLLRRFGVLRHQGELVDGVVGFCGAILNLRSRAVTDTAVAALDDRVLKPLDRGPAANFITLFWHIAYNGAYPVFLYRSNMAIQALARTGLLSDPRFAAKSLAERAHVFFYLNRWLLRALERCGGRPTYWEVEHFLDWTLARLTGGESPGETSTSRVSEPEMLEEISELPEPDVGSKPRKKPETVGELHGDGETVASPRPEIPDSEPADSPADAPASTDGLEPISLPAQARPGTDVVAVVKAPVPVIPKEQEDQRRRRLRELMGEFQRGSSFPSDADREWFKFADEYRDHFTPGHLEKLTASTFREFISSRKYGATGMNSQLNRFLEEAGRRELKRLRSALQHLLHGEGDPAGRLADVSNRDGKHRIKGLGEAVCTKVLAVWDRDSFLPVLTFKGRKGKRAVLELLELGLGTPESQLSPAQRALKSNQVLVETLRPWLNDCLAMARFIDWCRLKISGDGDLEDPIDSLAETTHLDRPFLVDLDRLMRWRRQVVLCGPGGVGKTFLASAFAEYFARDPDRVTFVSCHPGLGYGDFVEHVQPGGRQVSGSGPDQLRDEAQAGIFIRACQRAQEQPDEPHVIVLDDMDLLDLDAVWGEVRLLLNDRGSSVRLAGSDSEVVIPANLHVLATLTCSAGASQQTAAFLLRRFAVMDLAPDPLVLERWFRQHYPKLVWAAGVFRAANSIIGDVLGADARLGHAGLMVSDLNEGRLILWWQHSVLPVVAARARGRSDSAELLARISLRRLRDELDGEPPVSIQS